MYSLSHQPRKWSSVLLCISECYSLASAVIDLYTLVKRTVYKMKTVLNILLLAIVSFNAAADYEASVWEKVSSEPLAVSDRFQLPKQGSELTFGEYTLVGFEVGDETHWELSHTNGTGQESVYTFRMKLEESLVCLPFDDRPIDYGTKSTPTHDLCLVSL
ncbi:hypothetical protein VCHA53O466_320043 [Vibrio chagasii]|nr:hypothetical protein VCHA53O466_320043 [Vibrio chagasii]